MEEIGTLNPLRYRGYVYDNETHLYYLQSRYYNPNLGRFLNADGYVATGQDFVGYNMFAYCNNNPIAFVDTNGQFSALICCILVACTAIGGYLGCTSEEKLWVPPNERETEDSKTLTTGDRIKNTLIGASFGLGIGGLIVSTGGAVGSVMIGSPTTYIPLFDGTGLQTFARGALFYDFWAIIVSPFLGIEIEPIEVGPPAAYYPVPFEDNPRYDMW